MSDDLSSLLIIGGVAVGGYLLYQYYLAPSSTQASGSSPSAATVTTPQAFATPAAAAPSIPAVLDPTQAPNQSPMDSGPMVSSPMIPAPVLTVPATGMPGPTTMLTPGGGTVPIPDAVANQITPPVYSQGQISQITQMEGSGAQLTPPTTLPPGCHWSSQSAWPMCPVTNETQSFIENGPDPNSTVTASCWSQQAGGNGVPSHYACVASGNPNQYACQAKGGTWINSCSDPVACPQGGAICEVPTSVDIAGLSGLAANRVPISAIHRGRWN